MIARIRGTLLARELDSVEVMTSGGVGYELHIPRSVYEKLPAEGKEVELLVHQVVREDALLLFGFLEASDRMIFTRLLGATGVGPRLALSLLSALPAPRLIAAVRNKDLAALTTVSGVGKKTAERLVLELSSKLDDIPIAAAGVGARGAGSEEALRALTVLGFTTADADRAIREALEEQGPLGAQELIREALKRVK